MSFLLFLIVSLGNFALGYFVALWLGFANFGSAKSDHEPAVHAPAHPEAHPHH